VPGVILLIAACYFRPAAILMAPVLAVVALMNPTESATYRLMPVLWRGLIGGIIIGLSIAMALAPWAWRNQQRLGAWIWTTTNAGVTLYDGFNPRATGASDQQLLAGMPGLRSMNEVERSRFLSEAARDWARGHVDQLPMLGLRKVLRSWSPVPLSAEFGRPSYRIISGIYAVPFDLFLLAGLFSRRIGRNMKLLLVTPAVLITVIEVMSVGSIRYRIPAEAPLAVIVAVGVVDVVRFVAARHSFSITKWVGP
jgi:hypothetical protein